MKRIIQLLDRGSYSFYKTKNRLLLAKAKRIVSYSSKDIKTLLLNLTTGDYLSFGNDFVCLSSHKRMDFHITRESVNYVLVEKKNILTKIEKLFIYLKIWGYQYV